MPRRWKASSTPDRDAQFHYLNEQARDHQDGGAPVISVDTKKKELVGPFKNNGREWEPRGKPVRVDTHVFPDRVLGRAVPYGIYDVAANTGWVNVGTDHAPPRSPSSRSAVGGTEPGGPRTRRPAGC
ncbi:Rhodopirellula transposase DDE domain-containing protein [Streptomyces misionensis]|uniref:Rhodopirellula transposase DDE domain-containing protein n=1 Tax=Streptomyces misionensis TaxID=67331 RepID=A0A1H4ZCL5_9ACTN|nr:Rhodopirellula transposase DDE domain-containing protein [Streptomyces misionensis]